ncbi:MAG: hypothetical protein KBF75_09805 [Saprospiraceae bacterium]|jgi:hypothetical protein|nr:hypothetical protein [Saprospiraceae bacterium]MCA0334411.1 hypothetical protein [Bacteroidota bacterium]HMT77265.1 hypothetical protein [Saprospiraceae bacterium]
MNEAASHFKLIFMYFGGLISVLILFFYFFVMPDEVFEINIDSSVEKLDTFYVPKLGSGGHYNNICRIFNYEMNDSIKYNGLPSYLSSVKEGKACSDGYEMVGDTIHFEYNRYKATKVKIKLRYEFYEQF